MAKGKAKQAASAAAAPPAQPQAKPIAGSKRPRQVQDPDPQEDQLEKSSGAGKRKAKKPRAEDADDYEGPVDEQGSSNSGGDAESEEGGSGESGSESSDGDGEDELIELDGQLEGGATDDSDTGGGGILQVNFDFCDPAEAYFQGIRSLLSSYLPPKAGVDPSQLADLVVAQGAVGTIVVQEGGEDAFAFITAVPLQFHKDKPVIQALTKYLLSKAGEHRAALAAALADGKHAGLLLHEQLLNLPFQLIPHLHQALAQDVSWALENEISREHKDKFKFDSYILVAPCEVMPETGGGGGSSGDGVPLRDLCFLKFDDEVLTGSAQFHFDVAMPSEAENDSKPRPQQRRVIALLEPHAYAACLEQITAMAAGS